MRVGILGALNDSRVGREAMIIHNVPQNTPAWDLLRSGKPTASKTSSLVTPKGKPSTGLGGYAKQLAKDTYAKKPVDQWKGNKHTNSGHKIEDEAAAAYAFETGYDVQKVGFCTDDLERYGASPDRFVNEDGLLEVKGFPELHLDVLLEFNNTKKCPAAQIPQTQMQMFICEKAWCDVFYYSNDFPSLLVRVFPDPVFVRLLKMQLAACIAERDKIVKIINSF